MKREDVYKIIDGEREFQNTVWDVYKGDNNDAKAVGSHLTLMATYLRQAQDGYTHYDGNRKALEEIRKIAALAVRCMELHDAPERSK